LPKLDAVRVDAPVLLFAVLLTALTALEVGLAPAFQSPEGSDVLRTGGAPTGTRRARRLRHALVAAELAASLVLLVGAALLGRSFLLLTSTDVGASTDHVAQALVSLSLGRTLSLEDRVALVDRIVDRVAVVPGVRSAAASASLPPNRPRSRVSFTAADQAGRQTSYLLDSVSITPAFFETLGVPLLQGRPLSRADGADSPPVMLVSTMTARRFFGERDPIGRTLPLGPPLSDGRRADVSIVGLVGDVKYNGMDAPPDGAIYRTFAQSPTPSVFVVARTAIDPASFVPTLRRELATLDPGLAVYDIGTLDALMADAVAQPRFRSTALAGLALLALTLAAVGLYGVVSYSVSQRAAEIGIRVALGARSGDVLVLVVREGLQLAAVGIVIGVAASLALARTVAALLYGVPPTDVWSFAGAASAMAIVTLVASIVPARRAMRVDPAVVLRGD
jgi:putative ABC transport system permease protein